MAPVADNEHQLLGFELAIDSSRRSADRTAIGSSPAATSATSRSELDEELSMPRRRRLPPGQSGRGPRHPLVRRSRLRRRDPQPLRSVAQEVRFYAKVGVRELLLVDRKPWRLELYRRRDMDWSSSENRSRDVRRAGRQPGPARDLPPGPRQPAPQIEVTRPSGTQNAGLI